MSECTCEYRGLTEKLRSLAKKATEEEREALNEVWARMEAAEVDIAVRKAKEDGDWPSGPISGPPA